MKIHTKILPLLMAICLSAVLLVGLSPQVQAASAMKSSDKLVSVLKTMEGFHAYPYWDYSQYTVGYGTKCPDDKLAEYQQKGITKEAAEKLLKKELEGFEKDVNNFAAKHGLNLKQQQFDALVSFTYNLGAGWMSETSGYFYTAIREQDMGSRLVYGFMLNSKAGGSYILQDRRLCEVDMYLNGVYKAYNASDFKAPENCKYVYLNGNGGDIRYTMYGYYTKDELPPSVNFTKVPVGKDADGNPFVYTFAGWYTNEGKKVEKLDGSLANGKTLYAKWMDPSGKITDVTAGEKVEIVVTVTSSEVNIRKGPGTDYSKVGTASYGQKYTVTEVQDAGGYTWGKISNGWLCLDYTNYDTVIKDNTTQEKVFPWNGTVNDSGVNYRSGPGTSYKIMGQKNKGDAVTISEEKSGSGLQWGKMADGNWICLKYVDYNEKQTGAVTSIKIVRMPDKMQYDTMSESLQLEGSVLQVTYADGSISALSMTKDMVSSYTKTGTGVATVKISYQGKTTSFEVRVGRYSVKFLNWDGSVISDVQYDDGATVKAPADPQKPADETYTYVFTGWDKPVVACTADAVYTAVYSAEYIEYTVVFNNADGTQISSASYHYGDTLVIPDAPKAPEGTDPEAVFRGWTPWPAKCTGDAVFTAVFSASKVRGDFDGDFALTDADAVYLLRHTLFPEQYPVAQSADVDKDGIVTDADAVYLLRHTLFPEQYPFE